jgi:DNA-binding NarL/FixJ family response regulator
MKLRQTIARMGHELASSSDDAHIIVSEIGDGRLRLAMHQEPDVAGLLPINSSSEQIGAALNAVAVGLSVRAPYIDESGFDAAEEIGLQKLFTPRELDVLAAMREGLTNKAIALRLDISLHTVKFHIEAIFRKLGVRTRTAAIRKARHQMRSIEL